MTSADSTTRSAIQFAHEFDLSHQTKNSTIQVGRDAITGMRCVRKVIKPNTHMPPDGEAIIHQHVSGHPNIVPVLETRNNQTEMLLPYFWHGDLWTWASLHHRSGLPLHLLKSVAEQIALALAHCHEQGVIHRDVKAENVFVVSTEPFIVQLGDFGLSWYGPLLRSVAPSDTLGTPSHMAPEVIRMDGSIYGSAVDVWGFGVMLYEMLNVGASPFDVDDQDDSMTDDDDDDNCAWLYRVRNQVLYKEPVYDDGTDNIIKPWNDLFRACLQKNPNDRPCMTEVLKFAVLRT